MGRTPGIFAHDAAPPDDIGEERAHGDDRLTTCPSSSVGAPGAARETADDACIFAWVVIRLSMADTSHPPLSALDQAHKRRLAAMRLQEIEGNPPSPDQVVMFEM